jgi:uncharacterized protein (TIGR03083 family)
MPRPATRAALLQAIDAEFARLMAQVDQVPPADRQRPGACDHWSVKDLLIHLDAWHDLFLGWEQVGSRGGSPQMPAAGYTWAETPALNEAIHQRTKDDPWEAVQARLRASTARVRALVAAHTDEDLFTKKRYAWTGSTSLGSYAVSCTSSHYAWATQLIRKFARALG